MPRYAVRLRFASPGDRDLLVPRLRELVGTEQVVEDGDGARVVFDDVESPVAALVRSQMLLHTACSGTTVTPADVRRTPAL